VKEFLARLSGNPMKGSLSPEPRSSSRDLLPMQNKPSSIRELIINHLDYLLLIGYHPAILKNDPLTIKPI
jgi:hypothetical protein